MYPLEEWSKIEANFRNVSLTSKDARKFARFFFAGAATCEIDKQGRALIPQVLRDYAGITKDLVSAGVMNKVEIWSKERWEKESGFGDMDSIAEKMAEYGLSI